jgi:hypothetical protein
MANESILLINAIKSHNFILADKLWFNGARLSFPLATINESFEHKNIEILKWLYTRTNPNTTIRDLKWAFQYADIMFIYIIWNRIPEPDLIDTIDIIEIIINRGDYTFLQVLSILRKKSSVMFLEQINNFLSLKLFLKVSSK